MNIYLAIPCDLFEMVKSRDPNSEVAGESGDLQPGDKKVTAWITHQGEQVPLPWNHGNLRHVSPKGPHRFPQEIAGPNSRPYFSGIQWVFMVP